MSDCSNGQTMHAVVLTEKIGEKDAWDFYPPVICAKENERITFFIRSHFTSSEIVTIIPEHVGFFSSADLSTHRNSVLVTKVVDKTHKEAKIIIKSGSKPKSGGHLLPILVVKVRR